MKSIGYFDTQSSRLLFPWIPHTCRILKATSFRHKNLKIHCEHDKSRLLYFIETLDSYITKRDMVHPGHNNYVFSIYDNDSLHVQARWTKSCTVIGYQAGKMELSCPLEISYLVLQDQRSFFWCFIPLGNIQPSWPHAWSITHMTF